MLRGHVFSEQVFGVDIFALFVNQFLGGSNGIVQNYKDEMAMINTSNSITINEGALVIQGRYIEEHSNTIITYTNTDSAYCSLVVEIDLGKVNTKTSLEQVRYKILKDETSYPTLIQNDIINKTGNIYQFELARFQSGITGITNFTDRRTYVTYDSVYNAYNETQSKAYSCSYINEALAGTVLYENDTGSKSNITLSDSAANYSYIEIFFSLPDGMKSLRVYNPNNKAAILDGIWFTNGFLYFYMKRVKIENNMINVRTTKTYSIRDSSTWTPYGENVDNISITKVVGYKF